jgi:hypothetical protein
MQRLSIAELTDWLAYDRLESGGTDTRNADGSAKPLIGG